MGTDIIVNGRALRVEAAPDTRLLWVLREELKLTGTKFGCGAGMCGACMVHLGSDRMFSCQVPLSELGGRPVTTIEGLSSRIGRTLQAAWQDNQVPQCGYCQSGQIMSASALLMEQPKPTREQIVEHMSANICRCGTYSKIVEAIEQAVERI
jgi:isoquinoline 1-oxidoreductase alpha subunit